MALVGCNGRMVVYIVILFAMLRAASAVRVSDKIYKDLQGNMACFKRFNGTHEVGCTSDYRGNVGVLYIPVDAADANWVMKSGPHSPYILALYPDIFNREVLINAKNSKNVRGVVLLDSEEMTAPSALSPASTCPSHPYGMYNYYNNSQYKDYCSLKPWNPYGSSLLYESFDFPIFLIQDDESVQAIIHCYNKFNNGNSSSTDWPLCAIQLHSNMFGTTSSEVCLRRTHASTLTNTNYCDPIHDYNIFGTINPMSGSIEDSSVIVVAARADAASMFDNISPGANAAVTGLVTLLAVAQALNNYSEYFNASGKNVLFVLFEGETWDYLGSVSVSYDMDNGNFPFPPNISGADQVSNLNFSHIDYFIELSQIGMQSTEEKNATRMYLYSDPISAENPAISSANEKLRTVITEAGHNFDVLVETAENYPLPPASLQSFLKRVNISGTVIADHKGEYENKYYQSFLDDYQNVRFESTVNSTSSNDLLHVHLNRIASTVASAVYKLATGTYENVQTNETLIAELLVCFLRNVNCTLFRDHAGQFLQYSGADRYFQPRPAKMYCSVELGEDILTNITLYLMGNFLGEIIEEDRHECWSNRTSAIQKFFMPTMGENGTCFQSTARLLSADSPAFRIPDYNFSSGEYPSWTESGWSHTSARLFLKPAPAEEIGLVLGGCVFVIITALVSYWAQTRASILFVTLPEPQLC